MLIITLVIIQFFIRRSEEGLVAQSTAALERDWLQLRQ